MVRKTQTTSFGSVVRESHSSKKFYSSKLFKDFEVPKSIDFKENAIDGADLNRIYCKSSENMDEIPDDSIHLMITSPPYNVGKEYDDDLSLDEYLELLTSVFRQCYKKLVTGGRACINIANIGRKPYIPLHAMIIEIMLDLGFLMRGEIIWDKSASGGGSCAWGSWMSASNPVLDPFCGSGTTCIAAIQNNRSYIAYDIKKEYVDSGQKREFQSKIYLIMLNSNIN